MLRSLPSTFVAHLQGLHTSKFLVYIALTSWCNTIYQCEHCEEHLVSALDRDEHVGNDCGMVVDMPTEVALGGNSSNESEMTEQSLHADGPVSHQQCGSLSSMDSKLKPLSRSSKHCRRPCHCPR